MSMTSAAAGTALAAIRADVHVTGQRIVATVVDGFVIGALYSAMAATFGTITTDGGATHWTATMPVARSLADAVVVALCFILLEGYRGQMVGKMLVGVKVVNEAIGTPPGPASAAVRTVLRVVDGLLGDVVAFIVVLTSAKRQRLGDMAARTLVVRAKR
jgi:uncharacterized RDD family membrane protein YckC